jgi:hypothetical protein
MSWAPILTCGTDTARGIDFPDHSFSNKGGMVWCVINNTDELMSQHSLEIHIAFDNM